MSWPQRQICWLSIYLSLLALCIHATEVSKETTINSTQSSKEIGGNEKYEVIDVAQRNLNGKLDVNAGQTTRIIVNEDVDDNFWLKHLGEDFKYAIHLQVGDSDRYDGVYNMTEDGSNYDLEHDYGVKEIPVDGNKNEVHKETQTQQNENQNQQQEQKQKQESQKQEQEQQQKQKQQQKDQQLQHETEDIKLNPLNTENTPTEHKSSSNEKEKSNNEEKVETAKSTQDGNDFEQIFALNHDDGINLMKKLQSMKKYTDKKVVKTPDKQDINIKYTEKSVTDQHNDPNKQDVNEDAIPPATSWQLPSSSASPIVVTLPHNEKTVHQLADENTPVVVKMPPVIYHHNPNYNQLSPASLMNAAPPHLQHDPNLSQHQHNQFTTPTHTHSHQQQYFTQYSSPSLSQQQQQQPYNAPSLLEDAAAYRSNPVYSAQFGANLNAFPNQNSKEKLQKTNGSIRFILRKPSRPYNGLPAHNQLPFESSF